MKRYWIVTLVLGLFSPPTQAQNCPTSNSSCEFYRCMEKEKPCGKKGYWQDFGTPYCEVFVRDNAKFSELNQLWLRDVRECLQVRLAEIAPGLQCGEIKDEALHSHVSCYVDTGFCNLPFKDKAHIFWYLKGSLRDVRTWREAELLRQACQNP